MKLLAQVVGIFAVASYLLSYQLKRRKQIIVVNATSSFLYVLQYILLGAFEGAAIDVLSAVSTVVAHNSDKKFVKKYLKFIFLALNIAFCVAGIILYKNIYSLFPVAGAMLQSGAFWLKDEKHIRLVSFLGAPFWLVYNALSGAYGPAIGSVLSLFSIGIAIIRYDICVSKKK